MLWFFLILASVCVFLIVQDLRRSRIARLANHWPSAKGIVRSWRIKESGGGEVSSFELTLNIQIEADGRIWTSLVEAGDDFTSEEAALECAREFGDRSILVYYDPDNPARGSLDRDPLSIVPRN